MPNLPELDLDVILGLSPLLDTPITTKASFLSPYTCKPRAASTLGELLRGLIPEVTQKMLRLSDTVDEALRTLGRRPVRVTSVGYTPHLVSVQKTLQVKGIPFMVTEHTKQLPQSTMSTRGGSNLIAIVGMAGRLPGSETVEDYWQSLLDQKRFVKEVLPIQNPTIRTSLRKLTMHRFPKRDLTWTNGSERLEKRKIQF